jgi:hypothetical protein
MEVLRLHRGTSGQLVTVQTIWLTGDDMVSNDVTVNAPISPVDVEATPARDLAEVLSEVRADARALAGDYLVETEVPHGGE